jgi:hypothetical protein
VLKDRPSDLPGFIDEARKYAQGEYAAALYKGADLSADEKAAVAKKLSHFTRKAQRSAERTPRSLTRITRMN